MESLELLILKSIFHNPEYATQVLPFIRSDIFESYGARNIANMLAVNFQKHNEALTLDLVKGKIEYFYQAGKVTDEQEAELLNYYERLNTEYQPQPMETLIAESERYFRTRLTQNEMQNMIETFSEKRMVEIADIRKLEDGANFTFNTEGYYNYLEEFENRITSYTKTIKKYPFPIKALNDCTNGGMNSKSLTIAMASTGGGKSIFLCNCASHLIQQGYNVLYITCEMAVEEIAKRIDANLLDATQDSIMQHQTLKITLEERMKNYKDRDTWGSLFIKEYPAGYANSGIIRRDLEEIQRKYEKKVDVLVLDYLNLLNTTRYSTKTATSYTLVKSIAEEIRGLGQTFDIPVVSATQSNRSALNRETKIDVGLEAVSDSYGLPQTCDFMFNIIQPDAAGWKDHHYCLFKVLKNRWGDPNKEFIKVHLDTGHARFSNVEGFLGALKEKPSDLVSLPVEQPKQKKKPEIQVKTHKDTYLDDENTVAEEKVTTENAVATIGTDIFEPKES